MLVNIDNIVVVSNAFHAYAKDRKLQTKNNYFNAYKWGKEIIFSNGYFTRNEAEEGADRSFFEQKIANATENRIEYLGVFTGFAQKVPSNCQKQQKFTI